MTGPITRAQVSVHVVRPDGKKTGGFPREFQIPVETRILKSSDPVVRVVKCDTGAHANGCQRSGVNGTLNGAHINTHSISGNFGRDKFAILLRDGWFFSRVSRFEKEITGDDGDYINPLSPALPVGGTAWKGGIDWKASGHDSIAYEIDIEVVRAKGAY